MNTSSQIKIHDLTVRYGKHIALENVSFTLPLGPITGIVGPNGAGKSTLLKVLSGVKKPTSGFFKIETETQDISIAYVPQKKEINLDFPITVEEVVAQGALVNKSWWQGISKQDLHQARDYLFQYHLAEFGQKNFGELSGGQQQRVLLLRALMQNANILFLDEPFSGLDVVSEEQLIQELKKLSQNGMAIFIVHHDLHAWKKYFQNLVLLKKTLIAAGPVHDVLNQGNLQKAYGFNFSDIL